LLQLFQQHYRQSQAAQQMSRQLAANPLMQQHLFSHMHLPGNIFGQHSVLHQLGADVDADGDEDAVYLSPWAVGLAALLLLINGLFSVWLSLGLHKTLGTAAIRSVSRLDNKLLIVYLNHQK